MTLLAPDTRDGSQKRLTVWIDQSSSRCTIRLSGILDASTVAVFDSRVDLVLCRWCDELCIDLGGLAGIDAVGARLLTGFGHYATARGARLSVVRASPGVEAMIASAEADLS